MGIKSNFITITPENAAQFLLKNKSNRRISRHTVNCYAKDMKAGRWRRNGEAIVFDSDGYLRNGQHRLSAIVESGVSVTILVIWGVPPEECDIYDRGRIRSTLDSVILSERVDERLRYSNVIGAVKLLALEATGRMRCSDFEVEDFILKYTDEFIQAREATNNTHKKGKLNTCSSLYLAAYFTAIRNGVSQDTLKKFSEIFVSGIMEKSSQSSAIVLRNDIYEGRINTMGGSSDRVRVLYMIQKAIADFNAGIPRKKTYSKCTERIYTGFGE